ncbi:8-oxo-dGTP pyrophosphatase MutT (NUDIX family) [Nonomuraea fuscirosea]|uniref:8-oxo-dGTP pyrophosphatase MutT (NUDIX family) n=1 Tax=Nonomuraea fuscirosea TaxID=1291556 RepID=A0A2T0M5C6_9ACTN|nr:NUDIX domain-containing protein [Nonomuraea fuscirosea]PRX52687.1 8-oxo-dGTP pyrophosphatase MutT (NUDIX family) [Nonomuraea fuscirosea]
MTEPIVPAPDHEPLSVQSHGQSWLASWHPAGDPPPGRPHGSAGVCLTDADELVLISHDGEHWGFPAGRPEGEETYEETLRREMWEEACVTVTAARLLGYVRSECVRGHERGLVLVRAFWRAATLPHPWEPRFEIRHRRLVPAADARHHVRDPNVVNRRFDHRALAEAGLL